MPGMSLKQVVEVFKKRLPRDIGNAALAKAQNTCPVQTGDLFRSLYVKINTEGFELGATVPYASDIEEGTQPVMITGSWTGKWKRHKRQTKNGTTTIGGHTKTFKAKKPVYVNGQWKTLSSSSGREGTFFIKNALESSMDEAMAKVMASIGATK